MERISISEETKIKIKRYLKDTIGLYDYEKDIEILEKEGQLTEKLSEKLLEDLMQDCQTTREILKPEGEFKQEIEEVFQRFDNIPKPDNYEEYGYYNGSYSYMAIEELYENIQTCLEFKDVDQKHYEAINYRKIAESVINSINSVNRNEAGLDDDKREELTHIRKQLERLTTNETTKIEDIKSIIEQYNEHAISIWNNYLTNVNEGSKNNFRYLIHNMSKGKVRGDFRTKYMSTSLITNRSMGVFGGKSKYGLIIKPKHIVSADYKDTYTNNYKEDDDKLFNIKPPIKLPHEIEDICVKQTIEANGEMLNYDNESIYSEVVVDEYDIEGLYYISNGEKELSPNYETAKKMADERGVELKELDISQCREDNGLELMTEKMQIDFCRNILQKYCIGSPELEKNYQENGTIFINNHYKEFYERYTHLRENGEYTADDILKEFKGVILDEDIKRWEMLGFYHAGFFTGDLSQEDIQYTIDSRFDFSKCNTYEEFEQLYTTFCKTISGTILDERLEKYINEKYTNKEAIIAMKDKKDELRKIFESKQFSLDNISLEKKDSVDKMQDSIRSVEQKNINQENDSEQINEEVNSINECGEIIRPNNDENINKEYQEVEFSIEELNKQKESTSSKELQETNNIDLWMNRFKNWESCIDRFSTHVKAKFIKLKSDIVNAISNRIKGMTNGKENDRQDEQEK